VRPRCLAEPADGAGKLRLPHAGHIAQAAEIAAGKEGGKPLTADVRNTRAYASELEACGLKITERRSLGVRFWFAAGPWGATCLVAAVKP
jgi:hypothetical protein